ncbi:hypothetical protein ACX801_18270 [Arthrobacter bambusae]
MTTTTAKTRTAEDKFYETMDKGWMVILTAIVSFAPVAIVLFASEVLTLTAAVTVPAAVLAAIIAGVAAFRILKNQAIR